VIPAMRPRPPYLHYERLRHQRPHGQGVWYFRKGQGPRIRIRAPYGSPEFMEEYQAAISGELPAPRKRAPSGTLEWAVMLYKQSTAWNGLSPATRKQRDNIFRRIVKETGDVRLSEIDKEAVIAGRERRAATPAAARNFLETVRGLFSWAFETGLVRDNPTEGVKSRRIKSEGFPIWTEEEVARFQAHWPVGTRPRVAFDLVLYTGLRRGDTARLGRPHVRDGVARIQTEKTGTWVAIRLEPELLATLAAGPCGELTFIAGESGRPLTKESFGNYFREWCREAGLSKSAHGLRKVAATRAAERGYSNFEMDAHFGWQGGGMADLYTRKINREKLSLNAAERVRRVK
jgi:integrase